MTLVRTLSCVVALGTLAAGLAPAAPAPSDSRLLALALAGCYAHAFENGGYVVVSPTTVASPLGTHGNGYEQACEYVQRHLAVPGVDLGPLLTAFAARNARSTRLTLASAAGRGYVVDYRGSYARPLRQSAAGWESWHRCHPEAHGTTRVSLPLYDRQSRVVLVYLDTQYDWQVREGYLRAYRYDGQRLVQLGRVLLHGS